MKRTRLERRTRIKTRTPIKPRNAKRGGHRFPKLVDEPYREWIRAKSCLLAGVKPCLGVTEADHVKTRGAGGADRGNLVPLCTGHHRIKHLWGRKSFEQAFGLDLADIARELERHYDEAELAF